MILNAVDVRIVKYLKDHNYIYDYEDFSPRGERSGPVFISIYLNKTDMPVKP